MRGAKRDVRSIWAECGCLVTAAKRAQQLIIRLTIYTEKMHVCQKVVFRDSESAPLSLETWGILYFILFISNRAEEMEMRPLSNLPLLSLLLLMTDPGHFHETNGYFRSFSGSPILKAASLTEWQPGATSRVWADIFCGE